MSKQNKPTNHILGHHNTSDGVYEEDSILQRISLFCILMLLLPIICMVVMVMWIRDVITRK